MRPKRTRPPAEGQTSATTQRRSSAWVLRVAVSYLALPLTSLATGPLLARVLGPAERGELAAMLMAIALPSVVLSFGLQEATNYFVARGRASALQGIRVGTIPALICGVLSSALIWSVAPLLFPGQPQAVLLLQLGSLTLIPDIWFNVVRGSVLGRGEFGLANAERWLGALSRLVVLIAFALTSSLTLGSALWTTAGSSILGATVLLAIFRRSPTRQDPPPRTREVLRYGARSWVGTLTGSLNARLDQAVLLPFVGAVALGQYAVAATLAAFSLYFAAAVRDVLLTKAASGGGVEAIARSSRVLTLVVGIGCLLGSLTSFITIPLLFGAEYSPAIPLAQVLFLGALPASLNAALGAGLMAKDMPGGVSFGELTGLLVTIAGLLLLIGPLGVMGAVITSVASYTATTVVLVLVIRRRLGIPVRDCFAVKRTDIDWLRAEVTRMRKRSRPA